MNKQSTISKDEILYYLEEVMSMELSNPTEEALYDQLMYGYRLSKVHLHHVMNRMQDWYNVKF